MSEIGDLIAILGAADRAVISEEDETRRRQLADTVTGLVPAYRESAKFGWYEDFVEAVGPEQLPTIDEAMRNLAEPTRFVSMLPRRLMAVALAARVFPDRFGPGGEGRQDAVAALAIPGIVRSLPAVPTPPRDEPPETPGIDDPRARDEGERLLAALAAPAGLVQVDDWKRFTSSNAHLLSDQVASLRAPCVTTLVERPGVGASGAIGVLQTTHCVEGVDLETLASGFLDPRRWPQCCAWWCSMLGAPSSVQGLERYLEVVAADCPSHLLEVAVFLDFVRAFDTPTHKVVTYNLSRDQLGTVGGHAANGAVDVDRGTIQIRQEGDHLHVATTKRVRFTQFDTAALSAIACWVGYGDTATEVILNCAGGQAHTVDCAPDGVASHPDVAPTDTPLGDAVRRLAGVAQTCTVEAGEQARAVAERFDRGDYTPDVVAQDAARAAALALRGWAKTVRAAIDALRDVAGPPRSIRPPESPSFHFDQVVPEGCELKLAGALTSPYGESIHESRIELRPQTLGQTPGEFRLAVIDDSGLEGSAYTGHVLARNATTAAPEGRVAVYVIVP